MVLEETGFRVEFIFKPMDLRIKGLPELEESEVDEPEYIEISMLRGDGEAAKQLSRTV